ncbi:hypothetical protein EW146_g1301 [Bondarzewia mesenterica]|uniref:Uncharacterized protein n=1 Tax=Bondarzewia mesenterica TaxID=1095465 RepID=A0A4V6S1K3_9AGAM|nr:hypothetical protein EW146_g1301 [Bondarzewia mesenterica]
MFSHKIRSGASDTKPSSPPLSASPASACKGTIQPQPIRLEPIGVDPSSIIGKVLRHIRRSPAHPAVTLDFTDNTTYQIRVDGYDPVHRGVPKALEMNSLLDSLFKPPDGRKQVNLTIANCRFIKLKDTAHEWSEAAESRWNVEHLALAIKFKEEGGWHCVWATMAEYDGEFGPCKFRSFEDVYLDQIQRSPRKQRSSQKLSPPALGG